MCLVGEADTLGDVGDWQFGAAQQFSGPVGAQPQQVLVHGDPLGLLECRGKGALRQPDCGCHSFDGPDFGQALFNIG